MEAVHAVSVIIPLAPGEPRIDALLSQLNDLPFVSEILLCAAGGETNTDSPNSKIRRLASADGRAACLNTGAAAATGDWLWFLHADSSLCTKTREALSRILGREEEALYYFDLRFRPDRAALHFITERCVSFRSRFLKTPFGDQGFFIRRALFHRLGGFPDWDSYGEDHLFVRQARRAGVRLLPVGAILYTSGRRYKQYGFFRNTLRNQRLWIGQILRDRKRGRQNRSPRIFAGGTNACRKTRR